MNYKEPDFSAEISAQGGKSAKAPPKAKPGKQQEAFEPEEMGVSGQEIRNFIERVERLEEEKASLSDDIKEVMAEAKGRGYSPKAIRAIIKLRKQDPQERQAAEAILDLYMNAIGMV